MKKNKFISIIISTIVCVMMMIGCTTDQNSGQSAQSSGNDDGNKITSLQSVIDDPNVKDGSEIDLSQYKDIKDFNYNAIINKSVTIKNGDDLKGAKLEVVTDGVTLDSIKSASVTTQSSLKISSSSLSSLNIGEVSRGRGEETINPPTVETDNTTVANKVTVGIENAQIVAETLMAGEINLTGMNTQLTLKDNESSISKITTDTVCQVVLEKGVGTNIPNSTEKIKVSGSGELTQIDMTVQDGFTLVALTPMSSIKTLLRKGDSIDFSELVMLGTYKTTSRMKVFRANLTEDFTETFSKLEKNFTVTIKGQKAFDAGKAVESFDWASLESCDAEIDIDFAKSPDYKAFKFSIAVIGADIEDLPEFKLKSIEAQTGSVKKEYIVGDVLDLRRLVVLGKYEQGEYSYNGIITDYTLNPSDGTPLTAVGKQNVTVTAEGMTTTIEITVNEAPKPQVTVTFDMGGVSQNVTRTIEQDSTVDAVVLSAKTGYTFDGWYEKTGDKFADTSYDFSTNVTKNLTLYAVWTANAYTVTLWNDGDQSGDISVDVTYDTIVPSITVPTKTGFTFKGYFTENGGQGTKYIDDKGVGCKNWDIAENKTLFAYFLEKGKHSIEYRNTKGAANITPNDFKESDKVTLRSISTDGYTFGGWSVVNGDVTADETTDGWNAGERTADVILWARWTPNTNTAYKVEHWLQNIDGNDSTCDTTEDKTGTTGELTAAAAKSYGNFTVKPFSQSAIAADGSTVIKIYYTRDMIKFTFKPNGGKWSDGSTADKEILGRYQADVNKPADPTRDGFTFNGWDENSDQTPDTVATSFNEAKYYTAIWTSVNGITVTIYNTSTISVSDTSTDESIILTAADGFSDYAWKIDGAAASSVAGFEADGKTLTITKSDLTAGVVYQISLTAKKNGIAYNARVVVKK